MPLGKPLGIEAFALELHYGRITGFDTLIAALQAKAQSPEASAEPTRSKAHERLRPTMDGEAAN
jgi:hypothetical protein